MTVALLSTQLDDMILVPVGELNKKSSTRSTENNVASV